MTKTNKIIVVVVAIGLAFAAGRYITPEKIKTVEKTKTVEVEVIKEVIKEVEKKTGQIKNDRQTKTIITEYPDGRKVTEIFEINKDTTIIEVEKKTDTSRNEDRRSESETSKEVSKEYAVNKWSVGGLVGFQVKEVFEKPFYGIQIDRKIIGPVHAGVFATDNKQVGLTLRVSF